MLSPAESKLLEAEKNLEKNYKIFEKKRHSIFCQTRQGVIDYFNKYYAPSFITYCKIIDTYISLIPKDSQPYHIKTYNLYKTNYNKWIDTIHDWCN